MLKTAKLFLGNPRLKVFKIGYLLTYTVVISKTLCGCFMSRSVGVLFLAVESREYCFSYKLRTSSQ